MNVVEFGNLIVNGAVEGLIIALAALAITLVYGVSRFMNAMTGELMTGAAYLVIAGQKLLSLSLALSVVFALALSPILALAVWFFAFRKLESASKTACLLASLGLAFLLRGVLTFFVGFDQYVIPAPLYRGLNFDGVIVAPVDIVLAITAAVTIAAVFLFLMRSGMGRQMRAVSDDVDLALVSGILVSKVNVVLWSMVGFVSAIAGITLGVKTVVFSEMGWDLMVPAFAAAILGGLGNPVGAVAGGLFIGIAQELSAPFVGSIYKIAISFIALFIALIFRPNGLFGKTIGAR